MKKQEFLKRLQTAQENVQKEIKGNASSGSLYARGLASEGYAGGYAEALRDVLAILTHGPPADQRNYWKYQK